MMRKSRPFISLWLALLGIICTPLSAAARHEGGHVDRRSRAISDALREEGAEALSAKDLPAAKKALYHSFERNPISETLYFLGLLAVAEGRSSEAQDLLRRFLRELGESAPPAQQKEANRILAQPAPPFGELDVQGERGSLVSVDGRLLGVLPLSQPLILGPGAHGVQLGQGARRLEGPVEIRVGRTAQLRFDIRTGVAVVTLPPTVLLLEDYRAAPPSMQVQLGRAVEQAVRSEQLAVLSSRAALLRAPELGPCLPERSCQEQLMMRNEVDFSLHLYLSPSPNGAGLVLQGQLIDGPTGEALIGVTDVLDLQKAEQPAGRALALVTRLIDECRDRPRGTLEVLSQPAGAEVVLPRGVVGRTPYVHPVFAGTQEIVVQRPGFQSARVAVRVDAGKRETVQVLLNPLGTGLSEELPPSGPKLPRWRKITGIVGLSLGGALLTFGTLDLLGDRTDGKGIAGTVIGSTLVAGGILLLTLPISRAAKK